MTKKWQAVSAPPPLHQTPPHSDFSLSFSRLLVLSIWFLSEVDGRAGTNLHATFCSGGHSARGRRGPSSRRDRAHLIDKRANDMATANEDRQRLIFFFGVGWGGGPCPSFSLTSSFLPPSYSLPHTLARSPILTYSSSQPWRPITSSSNSPSLRPTSLAHLIGIRRVANSVKFND